METPPVSVIIPAFNAATSIERALRSVSRQTYGGEIEIIVINDGSTDQTLSLVQKYAANKADPYPLHLIDQKNAGVSAARNAGLAIAKNDVIAFLDSDDIWSPEKLARQISEMQKSPLGDWLCLTNIRIRKPDGREEAAWPCPSDILNPEKPLDLERFYACQVPVLPSTWLAPRRVFQKIGGFDERLQCAEDGEWVLRLLKNGGHLRMVDAPLTTYSVPETEKDRPYRANAIKVIWDAHLAWMQKECPPLAAYFMERVERALPQNNKSPQRSKTGLGEQTTQGHKLEKSTLG